MEHWCVHASSRASTRITSSLTAITRNCSAHDPRGGGCCKRASERARCWLLSRSHHRDCQVRRSSLAASFIHGLIENKHAFEHEVESVESPTKLEVLHEGISTHGRIKQMRIDRHHTDVAFKS